MPIAAGRTDMSKKKRMPDKLQAWTVARKRHRLSHPHVQMARELGMNPKKLGKLDNHRGWGARSSGGEGRGGGRATPTFPADMKQRQ